MAQEQVLPQALQWGRTPDGQFFIRVVIPITLERTKGPIYVPVRSFLFTKEEEDGLKASLFGLLPASAMPKNNSKQKGPGLHVN